MRYLLDTNACIAAMRGVKPIVNALAALVPADLAISSITSYELYTGVEKCIDPPRERTKVDILLRAVNQIEFDLSAALAAAKVRATLESRGEMIGPYDVLIAGQALSRSLVLVTANTKEFIRVSGLTVENWQLFAP